MNSFPIIRVITKMLIPYILLFGCYVQFHGDFGPGGGFQAGVILASALILYALVFNLEAAKKVAPPRAIEIMIAMGLIIYASTGVACMLMGGNFLDYSVLKHNLPIIPTDQHLGIFLVEFGVGVTVSAVMTMIFYAFAGRSSVA